MKICLISDTHTKHKQLVLPDANLLIHAGDFTYTGKPHEVYDFAQWIDRIAPQFKFGVVLLAGNHELSFDATHPRYIPGLKDCLTSCHYLEEDVIEING